MLSKVFAMTPWLFLFIWMVVISALFRTGTSLSRFPKFIADQPSHVAVEGSKVRARTVAWVLAFFSTGPLVFILAVRRDVGTDYASYVEIFKKISYGESLPWIDPLYIKLNQLAANFGDSGVVLVFGVSAFFAALPLVYRVYRSSPMPWLGMLILFGLAFPLSMTNIVRSAISVSVIMLFFPAIWRRELLIWTLGVLFAAGFHFTALLVWPLYWFLHLAWPKYLVYFGFLSALVVSVSRDVVINLLKAIDFAVPSKYSHYPALVIDRLDTYEFGVGFLIYIFLIVLLLSVWDKAGREGREIVVFRNSSLLGLLLVTGFYHLWALNRLGLYFLPSLSIFLPWIIKLYATRKDRLVWIIVMTLLFGSMFGRNLWVGAHDSVPYKWIFCCAG